MKEKISRLDLHKRKSFRILPSDRVWLSEEKGNGKQEGVAEQ
mgnify:FL=1